MNSWQKETLGLEVGDWIVWRRPLGPKAIPPKAIVRFESGLRLMVDKRMRWERVAETDKSRSV